MTAVSHTLSYNPDGSRKPYARELAQPPFPIPPATCDETKPRDCMCGAKRAPVERAATIAEVIAIIRAARDEVAA